LVIAKTLLIKYGEGKIINFAFYEVKDKISADRFRLKNKGEYVEEYVERSTNKRVNTKIV